MHCMPFTNEKYEIELVSKIQYKEKALSVLTTKDIRKLYVSPTGVGNLKPEGMCISRAVGFNKPKYSIFLQHTRII